METIEILTARLRHASDLLRDAEAKLAQRLSPREQVAAMVLAGMWGRKDHAINGIDMRVGVALSEADALLAATRGGK